MCLIVDACVANEVFPDRTSTSNDSFFPLRKDIQSGRFVLVYGGRLADEYQKCSASMQKILLELGRAGKTLRVSVDRIQAETITLKTDGFCVSNDVHVLALARASGARVVCTSDDDLKKDFKNPQIVSKPRGKVWSAAAHKTMRKRMCTKCS